MANQFPPLIVWDGLESWIVYPEENQYRLLAGYPKDEKGIVHAPREIVENLRGWWYTQTIARLDEEVKALGLNLEEFQLTPAELDNTGMNGLIHKLSKAGSYRSHLAARLARGEARLAAAKEAYKHAVALALGRQEDSSGAKDTVAIREARLVAQRKPLRNTKIEIIELEAETKYLAGLEAAVEICWNTISRIISAKTAEYNIERFA